MDTSIRNDSRGEARPRAWWRRRGLAVPFLLAASLAWTSGCSDSSDTITPPEPAPTTLNALEGTGLQVPSGTVVPEGPTVQILDQDGRPMAGIDVTFSVTSGGGTVVYPRVATDGQGRAWTTWILGEGAGTTQSLRATAGTISAEFQIQAVQPAPGQSYFGRSQYVEYFPGEIPVVLSAGHGGELLPAEIPDRTYGTFVQDRHTLDLALRIRQTIKDDTGYWPYLVVTHLHRIKVDMNREIVEAAQGNLAAERAWWEYHTYIKRARQIIEADFGEGYYIDVHGHGHVIQRLELGYMLSSAQLASSDEVLRGLAGNSSLKALAQRPGVDFVELIRGPTSLGSLLEGEGFPSVPSMEDPHPGSDPYFTGGYSTIVHGSRNGGTVSGVQIECNFSGVRDTAQNRQRFAEALSTALQAYFQAHFGMALAGSPWPGHQAAPLDLRALQPELMPAGSAASAPW